MVLFPGNPNQLYKELLYKDFPHKTGMTVSNFQKNTKRAYVPSQIFHRIYYLNLQNHCYSSSLVSSITSGHRTPCKTSEGPHPCLQGVPSSILYKSSCIRVYIPCPIIYDLNIMFRECLQILSFSQVSPTLFYLFLSDSSM